MIACNEPHKTDWLLWLWRKQQGNKQNIAISDFFLHQPQLSLVESQSDSIVSFFSLSIAIVTIPSRISRSYMYGFKFKFQYRTIWPWTGILSLGADYGRSIASSPTLGPDCQKWQYKVLKNIFTQTVSFSSSHGRLTCMQTPQFQSSQLKFSRTHDSHTANQKMVGTVPAA